jgi:hypothetical protein
MSLHGFDPLGGTGLLQNELRKFTPNRSGECHIFVKYFVVRQGKFLRGMDIQVVRALGGAAAGVQELPLNSQYYFQSQNPLITGTGGGRSK